MRSTYVKSHCVIASLNKRPRLALNVEWFHTGSSTLIPTNEGTTNCSRYAVPVAAQNGSRTISESDLWTAKRSGAIGGGHGANIGPETLDPRSARCSRPARAICIGDMGQECALPANGSGTWRAG